MPPKRPPLLRPTHFLCIPLATPSSHTQLRSSLSIFKADVSASSPSPSQSPPPTHPQIPPSAIRPSSTLHLTLHILNLSTPSKLTTAIQTLNNLFDEGDENQNQSQNQNQRQNHPSNTNPSPQIQKTPHSLLPLPLPPLTLHSLSSMHAPHSTSILYTSPMDPEKHLQIFCEAVRERFIEAGFVLAEKERERDLLLHATIVNTIYIPRGYEHEYAHAGPGPERGVVRGGEGEGEESYGFGHGNGNGNETGTGNRDEKGIEKIKEQNQKSHTPPNPNNPHPKPKKQKPRPRLKFDAREILSRYADFTWMRDVRIEKVAICRMGAKKKGNGDEEYEVEAEVEVPWA